MNACTSAVSLAVYVEATLLDSWPLLYLNKTPNDNLEKISFLQFPLKRFLGVFIAQQSQNCAHVTNY